MTPPELDVFRRLPLERQLSQLESTLASPDVDPRPLLELCGALRDNAPLAWLARAVHDRGWLAQPASRAWFARFLVDQPETSVLKVLRALGAAADESGSGDLAATLLEALAVVPVGRLPTMCLIDRTLKHRFPEARDAWVDQVVRECVAELEQGRVESLSLDRLAQVRAEAVESLREAVQRSGLGAPGLAALERRRELLAQETIAVLAAAPKAVSQANAEELLARRVYTDPGHFLIELLQNAEDSGATTWRVVFDERRIVVWHDGTPFDARDVVGVTSIGQTTKRKQQIGFFGVGFKSVYEVTDRPRIYSDVYRFEIADVSIPKPLGARPADLPADGTVLILPLRDPADPVRSPRALYERARALDPVVLFTLAGIEGIDLELTAAAGGPERHAVFEGKRAGDIATIRQEPLQWLRSYRLAERVHQWGLGQREPGRPDRTTVMVGVQVDDAGVPTPLPDDAATVYSYLPTAESSGLRFFVQSHFDVPVDRERINADSRWNRWIVSRVPPELARIAGQLDTPAAARAFLDVLPLQEEVSGPFKSIPRRARAALADTDLLPGLDGALHSPSRTIVAPEALARLLGSGPLAARFVVHVAPDQAEGAALFVMETGLGERAIRVALGLGAVALGPPDLAGLLEQAAQGWSDGQPLPDDAPAWLSRSPDGAGLTDLHDLLLSAIEELERTRQEPAAANLQARLRRVPLVHDDLGRLWRAGPDGPALAETSVRAIYAGIRRLAHPTLFDSARSRRLLVRLGASELNEDALADDLGRVCALHGALDALPTPFPGTAERLDAALAVLAGGGARAARRVASLPLFPGTDGRRRALSRVPGRPPGPGLLRAEGELGVRIAAVLGGSRPVVDESAVTPGMAAFFGAVSPVPVTIDLLLYELRRVAPRDLLALHERLAPLVEELPSRARKELALLPIWPDRHGAGRPLLGDTRVLVPAQEAVVALFPNAPFLAPEVAGASHIAAMGVDRVGAEQVVASVLPTARPPLRIAVDAARAAAVIEYLARHGGRLGERSRSRLVEAGIFADDGGKLLPLGQLRHTDDPDLRALAPALAGRGLVGSSGSTMEALAALGLAERLQPLDPAEVLGAVVEAAVDRLDAHPTLAHAEQRARLYRVLVAYEGELFSSREVRKTLRAARFVPSERGSLLAPEEIVIDDQLPDLGIDWRPHAEVPVEVLALLRRQLGVGTPDREGLEESHLIEAYADAVRRRDRERAGQILAWVARQVGEHDLERPSPFVAAVRDGRLQLEGEGGRFHVARDMVAADPDTAGLIRATFGDRYAAPSRERYPDEVRRRLCVMGVPRLPAVERLAARMHDPPPTRDGRLALVALVGRLLREGRDRDLPLAAAAWLPDGTGAPRRPGDLFRWSPEVQALIGDVPERYPDSEVASLLGSDQVSRLGLKGAEQVELPDVVRHLERSATLRQPVLLRVYEWLDRGLTDGWIDAKALRDALAGTAWICADDGAWFRPERVLGCLAFRWFGDRRGYWERGAKRCPRLARALRISTEVGAHEVRAFLAEVAGEVSARSDRALLDAEPALPRMLLACYAVLGERGVAPPRHLPIVLAEARGRETGLRLLPATAATLFRSNTPTLEALFEGVGTLHLAARGPLEERAAIDSFHERLGVRRLRTAYEVTVAPQAGADQTGHRRAQIQGLRQLLRALFQVLPRVKLQRSSLPASGWVDVERLKPLASTGPIRAIADLSVRYVLPGVGAVEAESAAVYHPGRGELLVDAAVAEAPSAHPTGLALGLMACIFDGPGEEQLLDIVELLLSRRTRAQMEANLDQKHYPHSEAAPEATAADRLAERLGELLDYGLDRRLVQRFEELEGQPLAVWRDPAVLGRAVGGAPTGDRATLARRVAPHLLEAAGVSGPSAALLEALIDLLSAESLSEAARRVLRQGGRTSEPRLRPMESRPAPPRAEAAAPKREELDPTTALEELRRRLSVPKRSTDTARPASTGKGRVRRATRLSKPAPAPEPVAVPVDNGIGLWSSITRWLGIGGDDEVLVDTPPSWVGGDSGFAPAGEIPSQLWATRAARDALEARPATLSLAADPSPLPAPYVYAPQVVGGRFDGYSQRWLPVDWRPPPSRSRELLGRRVRLEGQVGPGRSQLPIPLHARLRGAPTLKGGVGSLAWQPHRGPGPLEVEVESVGPVEVAYEVELLTLPRLCAERQEPSAPAELRVPTVPLEQLPDEARSFVLSWAGEGTPWERALAAQAFVQSRYLYDDGFMERPDVRRARERLRAGRGNHHLTLLHASADRDFLGRGICYELNTMVLELCRHLGLTTVLATVWVLDGDPISRPDHLIALALVPTGEGAVLLPLDASVGDGGPRRVIGARASRSPAGPPAPPRAPVPPPPGPWQPRPPHRRTDMQELDTYLESIAVDELGALREERELLRRAAALVHRHRGGAAPKTSSSDAPEAEVDALRTQLAQALGGPDVRDTLLSLMRGEEAQMTELTPAVQRLVGYGLVEATSVPAFQVRIVDA